MQISIKSIEDYQSYLVRDEKGKATVDKYIRDVRKLYQFLPEQKQLTKEGVLLYKQHLTETYQPSSVNSMLAAVNSFFRYLGREDLRVKQVRRQRFAFRPEERDLTRNEYKCLLQVSREKKEERLHLILQTLGATGIRVSELPFITAAAVRKGRTDVNCKGKIRSIFLPHKLQILLKQYMRKQQIKEGPIFITKNGKPVHRSNIWREMKSLCKSAEVAAGKVFPHNLRHLFAKTYYQQEKDLVKLADVLGHSNIETTRIYTITSGKEFESRIDRLGLVI